MLNFNVCSISIEPDYRSEKKPNKKKPPMGPEIDYPDGSPKPLKDPDPKEDGEKKILFASRTKM